MNLPELAALVHRVPQGASITITSINVPDSTRGGLYGYVTIGRNESKWGFHSEAELLRLLERFQK